MYATELLNEMGIKEMAAFWGWGEEGILCMPRSIFHLGHSLCWKQTLGLRPSEILVQTEQVAMMVDSGGDIF